MADEPTPPTPVSTNAHQIPEMSGRCQIDREVWELPKITYDPTAGQDEFRLHEIGDLYEGGYDVLDAMGFDSSAFLTPIYSGVNLNRAVANKYTVTYTITALVKTEQWSCDMQEVSKDIRTWLVKVDGATTQTYQALAAIAAWEQLKDSGDWEHWQNFQYPDPSSDPENPQYRNIADLGDNPLKLAQKIVKGVESYSIYVPILTRQTVWNCLPPVGNAGRIDVPAVRDDWRVTEGADMYFDDWVALQNNWLKTGERSSPNGDGTFTFVEMWMGVDEIDGDLYEIAEESVA